MESRHKEAKQLNDEREIMITMVNHEKLVMEKWSTKPKPQNWRKNIGKTALGIYASPRPATREECGDHRNIEEKGPQGFETQED